MYQNTKTDQTDQQSQSKSESANTKSKDDVEDADYEVVDEDKKK